jgi:hypothetical protein
MTPRTRKRIEPGEKVALRLSLAERDLVLEHAFLDEEAERALRMAAVEGSKISARMTLDDLEELLGAIAAEANHAKSRRLQERLDAIYDKVQRTQRAYDDGAWPDSAPR